MRFIKSTEYREFILKMFVLAIGLCFLLLTIGCPKTDDPTTEIAPFISSDFTELDKITAISYFRSGCGHDYSDDFETNRSMKHYYEPFGAHRVNDDVKIFSPVDGQITEIVNEEYGSSVGLKNKQIRIRPSAHHELTIIIFHSDLISAEIIIGKLVTAGEHLAYAHMYYDDIPEYAHDFDIAVRQDVGNGKKRYLSYIELMTDSLFDSYIARGAALRSDFVISKADRDAHPVIDFNDPATDYFPQWVTLNSLP